MDTVDVCGEHIVEQFGGVEKSLKVGWVLLAPERRGYFLFRAPLDYPMHFHAGMADLVAPEFILPLPGRLYKQQIWLDAF